MDLLKLIKEKSSTFDNTPSEDGLSAVIHHIEIAEKHFDLGRSNGEYLFTDVVYRSNQAFEGALKEAYRILNSKDPSSKSPYQIEKFFDTNNILKERVLYQFTNYRQEWRNKSTHDYQLLFSSQEALLAIVSVSAFFYILLDQMLESHAKSLEMSRIEKSKQEVLSQISNYETLSFIEQCIEIINKFSLHLSEEYSGKEPPREYELLGKLAGYIEEIDSNIQTTSEQRIGLGNSGIGMIDLMLKKGNESIILEMKRGGKRDSHFLMHGATQQLHRYLLATNLNQGIVFIPTFGTEKVRNIQNKIIQTEQGEQLIAYILA